MPAKSGEMLTPRGYIQVVAWDSFASGFVNLDVRITSYTRQVSTETWYNVPTQFVTDWLGLQIDTTKTMNGVTQ